MRSCLQAQVQIEQHGLLERDWCRRDPVRYLPINALYQLTVLPEADFASAFNARLMQIPAYLRGARAHLRDRQWRALRVQLDVELQTHLSIAAAADRMQSTLGFQCAQARADLAWYTRAPAVPMGYAIDWVLLTEARSRLVPEQMPLKDFHDRLQAVGSVGLPWALARAFGRELFPAVESAVFATLD